MDEQDDRAVFTDRRAEQHVLFDGRTLQISPDIIADFRALLLFANDTFAQVVIEPPHLQHAGGNSWMRKKYGALDKSTWPDDIRTGFPEAFRVIRPHGTLIFKWNEMQIPVSKGIALTDHKPAIWQRTGKSDITHWIIFLKPVT